MTHEQLRAVSAAPVGSRVWVEREKRPYRVRARSRRFLVCTKPHFGTVLYFIVDLKQMVRGPENLVFGMGAESDADCAEMVDRLEGRRGHWRTNPTEVSWRNRVPLDVLRVEAPAKPSSTEAPHADR